MSGNIKVVVRCRPLNSREIARGAKGLVRMDGNLTFLDPQETTTNSTGRALEKETKTFTFDRSYWSAGPKHEPTYASQQTIFDDLGVELLEHAFQGFNTCIFAYGQTGSGKSYTMNGFGQERGIIPLTCEALFDRIDLEKSDKLSFTVEVSYIEIYQEKVRDLLNPNNKGNLRVREHPTLGPYVESLSKLVVQSFEDVDALMDEGTKARTVAATLMNETSSRSHAVFTLLLTQRRMDTEIGMAGEKVSRISLVDLAGSERATTSGATGTRLKEGALINKSLTTLGRVIATLAASSTPSSRHLHDKVPYRDSVLTWLLKDSLGGNSKTAMLAAISPADYEETLSTLRYADQAKKIRNKAVVNEDPNSKLIRELKEELALLRSRIHGVNSEGSYDPDIPPEKQMVLYRNKDGELRSISKADLQDQLEASERLMASVTETWEEKLLRTQEVQKEREQALETLGITIEKNLLGLHAPKKMPHLVNLNEDPLMSECLIYQIKGGRTSVGNSTSHIHNDIRLSGSSILDEHCFFESGADGRVTLHAMPKSITMVNGLRITASSPKELKSGYRIILGDFHVFRFNHPEEVRKARDAGSRLSALRSPLSEVVDHPSGTSTPSSFRPDSPMSNTDNADWSYARREAVVARLNGTNVDLDQLQDSELNKLYASILKVRHSRTSSSMTSDSGGDRSESQMSFLESVTEDGADDDATQNPWDRSGSITTWSSDLTSLRDKSSIPDINEQYRYSENELERKMKKLEVQMLEPKRHLDVRVKAANEGNGSALEMEFLSEGEIIIAQKVISHWRTRRRVKMAEDALSQAVSLKESNVISRELKKGVSYQFVVVEGNIPISACENVAGVIDMDSNTDPTLFSSIKPCIGVKVLDRRNKSIHIWSLFKLQQRLQQMRNLYKWIDKPDYSQHFSFEDPFSELPPAPAGYSFVGFSHVSLLPLARSIPASCTAKIWSPYTADPTGTCRIRLQPLSDSLVNTPKANSVLDPMDHPRNEPKQTQDVAIVVDRVVGFNRGEFESVHIQVHLPSFFGPTKEDEVLCSDPADLTSSTPGSIKLDQNLTFETTPEILDHLKTANGTVYFFARVKPAHFDKIERWDEARDASTRVANGPKLRGGDPENTDVRRRPEHELISEQRHDVLVSVEIRELDAQGEYTPAPVLSNGVLDGGAFFLRQGLQRRVVLRLSHNSGRGWSWSHLSNVVISNPRIQDGKGRHHSPPIEDLPSSVTLQPTGKSRRPVYTADGLSILSFSSTWDSSVHNSLYLNRNTPSNQRVLLDVNWEVEAANCAAPITFSMTIAVTIQSRDARGPSKLFNMISGTRICNHISTLFHLQLTPMITYSPAEVWRLDTSEVFVRGEEILNTWKPRGLSLIRDYDKRVDEKTFATEVEATKSILAAFPAHVLNCARIEEKVVTLSKVIELWRQAVSDRHQISLEKDSDNINELPDSLSHSTASKSAAVERAWLVGRATQVDKAETVAKQGTLAMLRDPTKEAWQKYWFVLRRPYLYVYQSSSETQDITVINLSTVRVEQSSEIEKMLERKFSFAIFTHQNSYFLQATNLSEMYKWIRVIDPSLAD